MAEYLRAQAEASLKDEMPRGLKLQPSPVLQRVSGQGTLWVDERGLPVRQMLDLAVPEMSKEYDARLRIEVEFRDFGYGSINSCGDGSAATDSGNDGLNDLEEGCLGTDPFNSDTDHDGLPDGLEVQGVTVSGHQWPSDPLKPSSTGDDTLDGAKWPATVYIGKTYGSAFSVDIDNDGVPNIWDEDIDGDGVLNDADLSPNARTAF